MIDIELDGATVRIPEFAMDKSIQTLIQLAKQQGFKTNEIEKGPGWRSHSSLDYSPPTLVFVHWLTVSSVVGFHCHCHDCD